MKSINHNAEIRLCISSISKRQPNENVKKNIQVKELLLLLLLLNYGKNPLLFQFIRKAIEWTVIIIEEFLSCLLHIKFFRTYFYRE